jgi:aminopeptidase-like protein
MTIDRNCVWEPTYKGTPFLSKHGAYPHQHGVGRGESNHSKIAQTYYELIGAVDGNLDLLEIADRCDLPIEMFDEAVEKFRRAGLINLA